MKVIHVHSHVLPSRFWNAGEREWHWRVAKVVTRPDGREYVDTMSRLVHSRYRLHATPPVARQRR